MCNQEPTLQGTKGNEPSDGAAHREQLVLSQTFASHGLQTLELESLPWEEFIISLRALTQIEWGFLLWTAVIMGDHITSSPSRNGCLSRHMIHGMHAFAGAKLAAERYNFVIMSR